jgi:hypothetical protein
MLTKREAQQKPWIRQDDLSHRRLLVRTETDAAARHYIPGPTERQVTTAGMAAGRAPRHPQSEGPHSSEPQRTIATTRRGDAGVGRTIPMTLRRRQASLWPAHPGVAGLSQFTEETNCKPLQLPHELRLTVSGRPGTVVELETGPSRETICACSRAPATSPTRQANASRLPRNGRSARP